MARPSALAALLQRYSITEVHAMRPLTEGLLNRAYIVDTDTDRYFLKDYLNQTPETIRAQHLMTRRLSAAGLPVSAPLADAAGETLQSHDGHLLALYPWVEGHHKRGTQLDLADCRELGSLLGRLHNTLDRLHGPVQQPLFLPCDPVELARSTAHRLLEAIGRLTVREGVDELAEFRLHERLGLLRELAGRRPGPGTLLTVGPVHGDFHDLNIMYGPKGVVSVVDWDRLCVAPCLEELIRSALIIFVEFGRLDLDLVREYVHGYLDERPWLAVEVPAAVHRLWWERLTDFWMLTWRYELNDHRPSVQFADQSAMIVWWTHHYDKVLHALC
jgi:Ser/Thr protein kinase RdoA (MazF antagonist)